MKKNVRSIFWLNLYVIDHASRGGIGVGAFCRLKINEGMLGRLESGHIWSSMVDGAIWVVNRAKEYE